jgi:hypothetical protein
MEEHSDLNVLEDASHDGFVHNIDSGLESDIHSVLDVTINPFVAASATEPCCTRNHGVEILEASELDAEEKGLIGKAVGFVSPDPEKMQSRADFACNHISYMAVCLASTGEPAGGGRWTKPSMHDGTHLILGESSRQDRGMSTTGEARNAERYRRKTVESRTNKIVEELTQPADRLERKR